MLINKNNLKNLNNITKTRVLIAISLFSTLTYSSHKTVKYIQALENEVVSLETKIETDMVHQAVHEETLSALDYISQVNQKLQNQNQELVQENEELVQVNNELSAERIKLDNDNKELRNMLHLAARKGTKPKNYDIPPQNISRSGVLRGEYIGQFDVTSYTPSKDECGNNKGITASGHPIIPGFSVAVDTKYCPIGTIFYVKGLGYTVALDTGSAVKGRNRLDYPVFDKEFAKRIGRRKLEVYLIKMGNGKVEDFDF